MARKLTHTHYMRDNVSNLQDLDISANLTTEITNVENSDNIGIQLIWNGAAPSGEVFIEVSNDYEKNINPGTWTELDFGVPILITGNSGNHIININLVPFSDLRLRYESTSGTGTMNAVLTMKTVGA